MLNNVFLKTLWDQRRSLMWWGIGMVAISLVTMLFYPSLSDAPELNDILSDENSLMKAFIGDIEDLTSPKAS